MAAAREAHDPDPGSDGLDEVAVGQHDPFGLPGGAGGVDDGGDVAGLDGGGPLLEDPRVRTGIGGARLAQLVVGDDARLLAGALPGHDHDGLQQRELVTDLEHLVELVAVLHDHHRRLGVPDDMAHLAGGVRHVDGGAAGPGRQDGEVGEDPLRTVLREQGDRRTRRHAEADQPVGDLPRSDGQLAVGDGRPGRSQLRPKGDSIRGRLGSVGEHVHERTACHPCHGPASSAHGRVAAPAVEILERTAIPANGRPHSCPM